MLQNILDNIFLGVILLIIVGIIYLPFYFILRKKQIPILRQLSYLGLAGIIFIILFATILISIIGSGLNFNPPYHRLNLIPFSWLFDTFTMSQVISNIIMFIPLGFLLPIVFKKFRSFFNTTLFAFAFSCFSEC
ncbi:MAG: VanZ family protein, partial [Turicibacter sanguinis]